MKVVLTIGVIVSLILVSCCSDADSQSYVSRGFGLVKVDTTKAISTTEMLNRFEEGNTNPVTFSAELTAVCATAGCWINVKDPEGSDFRVRFKNHFTIPKNITMGTKVWLHGFPYSDTISVELQKHFAEDEEKTQAEIDAIKKPVTEMNFEADGILFLEKTNSSN